MAGIRPAIRRGSPTQPPMPWVDRYANFVQPRQPRSQQRRRPERLGEHPAAGADVGGLPEAGAPGSQCRRRKRTHRRDDDCGLCIPRHQIVDGFAVGEVQPAPAGQQQLAAHRRHVVVDRHPHAVRSEHLRGHQTRRTTTHHRGGTTWSGELGHSSRLRRGVAAVPRRARERHRSRLVRSSREVMRVVIVRLCAYGRRRSSVPDEPSATPDLGVAVPANEEVARMLQSHGR